jgi:NACalpha-BTF3-like transcription factor
MGGTMKVTLEQIDELRNRVNVSYEEAKRTLEKNDGDLIKSIIELEKKKGRKNEKHHGSFTVAVNKVLALRMSIKNKDGNTILNMPVVVILAAFLMAFWVVIFGLVLAILTSCKINIYKDKATNVNNIKKNMQETVDKIKDKSEEIFKDDEEESTDPQDESENEIIIE